MVCTVVCDGFALLAEGPQVGGFPLRKGPKEAKRKVYAQSGPPMGPGRGVWGPIQYGREEGVPNELPPFNG